MSTTTPAIDEVHPWDPLHEKSPPGAHWTTANAGEAIPGVITPLGWSLWGDMAQRFIRESFFLIGAFNKEEAVYDPQDPDDRMVQVFHGRAALRVEAVAKLGDRMPGTNGPEACIQVFGEAPSTLTYSPTRRQYAAIAVKFPKAFLTMPKQLRAMETETHAWWTRQVAQIPRMTLPEAQRAFDEARKKWEYNVLIQTAGLFCLVTPMYDALTDLVNRTGIGEVTAITGGYGGFHETAVVGDIWLASRGQMTVEQIVAKHGFHGPMEGEVSGRVWREDPSPIERMVEGYRARPDSEDPRRLEAARQAERAKLETQIIAAVPAWQRPLVRGVLALAARRIPLRGVGKDAFLQALDGTRAAARRIGVLLHEAGQIGDPEDVFFLTADEIAGRLPADAPERIAFRRERREAHSRKVLPGGHWIGDPEVTDIGDHEDGEELPTLTGTGTSPGVVEGSARVVTDPSFADVEPDEVLVAPTTDPSWSSIMFISSALVVDIGGALSHAAIVARELGVPCVVNTGDGTVRIKTGDRVRVDGSAGTVEILERAES